MKSLIIVYSADKTDMVDKNNNPIKGTSITYGFNHEMKPVKNASNSVGQKPAKVWGSLELFEKVMYAPAVYEAEFEMKVGSDGKPTLVPVDLQLVSFGEYKQQIGSVTDKAATK